VDFAINYPGQWVSNPNPTVFLPCYAFGDPFAPGSDVANDPAFISYPFLQAGIPASHNGGTPGVPDPVALANVSEVGSLYGVAFSKPAQKLFTSEQLPIVSYIY
ncbi:MAG TPA: hypothetical protein PK029_00030, partial [Bacteroidales bacterium]|nr:hypothetical protein [Bacteroidales bacterium]